MIYSLVIETLKSTSIVGAKKTPLIVTSGLVYKLELDFPAGSAGLMGIAIFDGSTQIWPSNLGEWFKGESITISFDDVYLKEEAPFQFDILTYNLDDSYNHTVSVRIGLVSRDIFMARFLPSISYQFFEQMLKNLQLAQAQITSEQQAAIIANPFSMLSE